MEYILQVLEVLGVSSWEKLPGTRIRVDASHSKVFGVGHYLKED
jgi:hypothetical protein